MSKHYNTLSTVSGLSKVTFKLEKSDWHDHATETLWATSVRDNIWDLKNVPFYVYGVSFGDQVETENVKDENVFTRVHESGGHSTYRIFLVEERSAHDFEKAWESLRKIGCTYERATNYLIAVDVPPETNIYDAYNGLKSGEAAGVWDFEEGHCGHPLNR